MAANGSEHVVFSTHGCHLVARLTDSQIVSMAVASQIRDSLLHALKQQGSGVRSVRIDLGHVEQIGSAGLNELIGFRTRAQGQGLTVELAAPQPQVREVLMLTRLDRIFEVEEMPIEPSKN